MSEIKFGIVEAPDNSRKKWIVITDGEKTCLIYDNEPVGESSYTSDTGLVNNWVVKPLPIKEFLLKIEELLNVK